MRGRVDLFPPLAHFWRFLDVSARGENIAIFRPPTKSQKNEHKSKKTFRRATLGSFLKLWGMPFCTFSCITLEPWKPWISSPAHTLAWFRPFRKYKCRIFLNAFWIVFRTRSSDHFWKVQSAPLEALGPILAPFQFFLGRKMVPKSIRFSFGGSKSRRGEAGHETTLFSQNHSNPCAVGTSCLLKGHFFDGFVKFSVFVAFRCALFYITFLSLFFKKHR